MTIFSDTRARHALDASLAATTLIGGTTVVSYWLAHGEPMPAAFAGGAFVCAMCAVHVMGYRLYRRQPIAWSPAYRSALRDSIVVQLITFVLGSLILLSGIEKFVLSVFVGYWAAVGIIMCRRPESPTAGDLQFIRWGSLALLAGLLASMSVL
jgi:hypothetical protein